jgi:hypothetical protein
MSSCLDCAVPGREMMEIVHRVALGCRAVGSALSKSAGKLQTNWQGRSAGPAGGSWAGQGIEPH